MTNKSYSSVLARPSSLFIGVDLGTSGCRAIAINSFGEIKAHASFHYPEHNSDKSHSHHKQVPADWWHATQTVLKEIITINKPGERIEVRLPAMQLTNIIIEKE